MSRNAAKVGLLEGSIEGRRHALTSRDVFIAQMNDLAQDQGASVDRLTARPAILEALGVTTAEEARTRLIELAMKCVPTQRSRSNTYSPLDMFLNSYDLVPIRERPEGFNNTLTQRRNQMPSIRNGKAPSENTCKPLEREACALIADELGLGDEPSGTDGQPVDVDAPVEPNEIGWRYWIAERLGKYVTWGVAANLLLAAIFLAVAFAGGMRFEDHRLDKMRQDAIVNSGYNDTLLLPHPQFIKLSTEIQVNACTPALLSRNSASFKSLVKDGSWAARDFPFGIETFPPANGLLNFTSAGLKTVADLDDQNIALNLLSCVYNPKLSNYQQAVNFLVSGGYRTPICSNAEDREMYIGYRGNLAIITRGDGTELTYEQVGTLRPVWRLQSFKPSTTGPTTFVDVCAPLSPI